MKERLHFLLWKVKPFLRRIQLPETLCRPSRPPPRAAVPQLRRVGLPACRGLSSGADKCTFPGRSGRLREAFSQCLTDAGAETILLASLEGGPPGGHAPGPFPEVQTSSAFTRDHSSPEIPPVNLRHPNPCLRLRF